MRNLAAQLPSLRPLEREWQTRRENLAIAGELDESNAKASPLHRASTSADTPSLLTTSNTNKNNSKEIPQTFPTEEATESKKGAGKTGVEEKVVLKSVQSPATSINAKEVSPGISDRKPAEKIHKQQSKNSGEGETTGGPESLEKEDAEEEQTEVSSTEAKATSGIEEEEEQNKDKAPEKSSEEEATQQKRRVLLFEDRADIKARIREALVSRSFLVEEAHDIDEALKLYKRGGRFDAILLGLEGPLFLAIQFIESIPRTKIPIALLITQPAEEIELVIRKAVELGASCCVAYNEDTDKVLLRIEQLLQRFDMAEAEKKRMMEYLNPDYFINHAKRKDLSKILQQSKRNRSQVHKTKMRCLDIDGASSKQEVRMKFNVAVKKGQALLLKKKMITRNKSRNGRATRKPMGIQQLSEKVVQKNASDSFLPLLRDYQQRFKYAVLPGLPAPSLTAKRSTDLLQCHFREKVPKVISTLPQRFLRQGYELKESGDYEGAIRKFNRAISDPRYAAAYLSRGVTLHIIGNDAAAMKDMDRCIKLKEFESLAHCNKALIYYYKGDDDLALKEINRAIEHDRRDFGFYQCRALLHRRNGDFDLAKADYAKSRELIAARKSELKRSRSMGDFGGGVHQDTGISTDLIDPAESNQQYALDHSSPFKEMDSNNDGRVDLHEYKQANDYGVDVYSSIFQRPSVLHKICKKPPKQRTVQEIDFLVRTLNEIEVVRALPNRQVKVLCRDVKCASVGSGDCVIRQGDLGNYFYMVLSGEFAVKWDPPHGDGVQVTVNTVLAGGCFGEGTMYNPKAKRYASVFAQTPGTLFMVSRHSYFASRLNESMQQTATRTSDVLKQSKIFNSMSGDQFAKLIFVSKPNNHDRNKILVRQGEPGSKFCIIISGICKMLRFADVGAELIEKERKLAQSISQFEMSFTFHHTVKDPEARARAARATARYEAMQKDLHNVRNKLKVLKSKASKGNVAPKILDSQYLYPSNFFGEVSILDPYNGREPCTVVSETFAKVIEITKEELQTYKQSPQLIETLRSRSFYLGRE